MLGRVWEILPESQGHNLAVTVVYAPSLLDRGRIQCPPLQNALVSVSCTLSEERMPSYRLK